MKSKTIQRPSLKDEFLKVNDQFMTAVDLIGDLENDLAISQKLNKEKEV